MTPVDWSRYPDDWPQMRRFAFDAACYRCQGCGVHDRECGTQRTKLTVHHPDRDPENRSARLTVLCASCHLMVEGNARRRERVHAGRQPSEPIVEAWTRDRCGGVEGQTSMEVEAR